MSNNYDPNAALLVPVEGIGVFTFAMRSLERQFRIEAEYCRLTEGLPQVTTFLGNLAQSVADLSCLVISGPKGWDSKEAILAKDAFDADTYKDLQRVWSALCDKEAEFRGQPAPSQEGGQGAVEDDGRVVPPSVPPAAD